MAAVEMQEYQKNAVPSDLLRSKKPATDSAFQSSGETKQIHIHPTDPNVAHTHISPNFLLIVNDNSVIPKLVKGRWKF